MWGSHLAGRGLAGSHHENFIQNHLVVKRDPSGRPHLKHLCASRRCDSFAFPCVSVNSLCLCGEAFVGRFTTEAQRWAQRHRENCNGRTTCHPINVEVMTQVW
jgi:hypothetical protein